LPMLGANSPPPIPPGGKTCNKDWGHRGPPPHAARRPQPIPPPNQAKSAVFFSPLAPPLEKKCFFFFANSWPPLAPPKHAPRNQICPPRFTPLGFFCNRARNTWLKTRLKIKYGFFLKWGKKNPLPAKRMERKNGGSPKKGQFLGGPVFCPQAFVQRFRKGPKNKTRGDNPPRTMGSGKKNFFTSCQGPFPPPARPTKSLVSQPHPGIP